MGKQQPPQPVAGAWEVGGGAGGYVGGGGGGAVGGGAGGAVGGGAGGAVGGGGGGALVVGARVATVNDPPEDVWLEE